MAGEGVKSPSARHARATRLSQGQRRFKGDHGEPKPAERESTKPPAAGERAPTMVGTRTLSYIQGNDRPHENITCTSRNCTERG